jgi:hypothetical protein
MSSNDQEISFDVPQDEYLIESLDPSIGKIFAAYDRVK